MKYWYHTFSLVIFVLVSCRAPDNEFYYMTHPDAIQSIYNQCLIADKMNKETTAECVAAFRAIPTVRQYLTELINSPQQYGLEIMEIQIKLVKAQSDLYFATKGLSDSKIIDNLKNIIAKQQLQLETRYALIRLLSKMN